MDSTIGSGTGRIDPGEHQAQKNQKEPSAKVGSGVPKKTVRFAKDQSPQVLKSGFLAGREGRLSSVAAAAFNKIDTANADRFTGSATREINATLPGEIPSGEIPSQKPLDQIEKAQTELAEFRENIKGLKEVSPELYNGVVAQANTLERLYEKIQKDPKSPQVGQLRHQAQQSKEFIRLALAPQDEFIKFIRSEENISSLDRLHPDLLKAVLSDESPDTINMIRKEMENLTKSYSDLEQVNIKIDSHLRFIKETSLTDFAKKGYSGDFNDYKRQKAALNKEISEIQNQLLLLLPVESEKSKDHFMEMKRELKKDVKTLERAAGVTLWDRIVNFFTFNKPSKAEIAKKQERSIVLAAALALKLQKKGLDVVPDEVWKTAEAKLREDKSFVDVNIMRGDLNERSSLVKQANKIQRKLDKMKDKALEMRNKVEKGEAEEKNQFTNIETLIPNQYVEILEKDRTQFRDLIIKLGEIKAQYDVLLKKETSGNYSKSLDYLKYQPTLQIADLAFRLSKVVRSGENKGKDVRAAVDDQTKKVFNNFLLSNVDIPIQNTINIAKKESSEAVLNAIQGALKKIDRKNDIGGIEIKGVAKVVVQELLGTYRTLKAQVPRNEDLIVRIYQVLAIDLAKKDINPADKAKALAGAAMIRAEGYFEPVRNNPEQGAMSLDVWEKFVEKETQNIAMESSKIILDSQGSKDFDPELLIDLADALVKSSRRSSKGGTVFETPEVEETVDKLLQRAGELAPDRGDILVGLDSVKVKMNAKLGKAPK